MNGSDISNEIKWKQWQKGIWNVYEIHDSWFNCSVVDVQLVVELAACAKFFTGNIIPSNTYYAPISINIRYSHFIEL